MKRKPFWSVRSVAGEGRVGELSIYGVIGGDDEWSWLFDEITPKQFKEDLDSLGLIDTLNVMINSPGGDTFAGQAIHTMLSRHPAQVNVYIDGLAASIASLIAMAGDRVIMPRNAMLMVHDPFTSAEGNAREFRQLAEALDTIREAMIAAYQRKTEMDHDELVALLEAETWMTAEDAVRMGFADEIEPTKAVKALQVRPQVVSVNGLEVSLERFKHPGEMWEHAAQIRDESRPALTIRDAERALVAGGFPGSLAKGIVATGFKTGTQPPPEDEATESGTLQESAADGQALNRSRLSYYRSLATSWS